MIDSSASDSIRRHLGDAVEVYLGEADAWKALPGVLKDEPTWARLLVVKQVAHVDLSRNY